jgi:hypothetical protein
MLPKLTEMMDGSISVGEPLLRGSWFNTTFFRVRWKRFPF